ncbi:MAG: MBOAT family O-acyltransferase [Chloroflexota bacterium]
MLFNSQIFLYSFLPITYIVFWRLQTRSQRYFWLTVASYVFYGFWDFRFCGLMAFSTAVSYLAGRGMLASNTPFQRRMCLIVPIVVDIAVLCFFKYFNFALETSSSVMAWLGMPVDAQLMNIILPVGISFYTFHTITYIVDSYRGTVKPTRNVFEFACYVSLFSQLVAGPIVRFRQIERDLEHLDTAQRGVWVERGCSFFALGMIEKVLIADSIAQVIDPALMEFQGLSTLGVWLCMLGYSYQLFFDFVGYSDMAVGLGLLFGVRIPQNFNSPYQAANVSDFWRRWHMSLSSCLRDYLYIPLGGSRGHASAIYRNLLITMVIGGLWHGASWTFVVWGAYHGLLLCLYRACGRWWDLLPLLPRQIGTFLLVLVGWVFFRSMSFEMAGHLLFTMFIPTEGRLPQGAVGLGFALCVAGFVAHRAPNTFEISHQWRAPAIATIASLFGLCLLLISSGQPSPFLYFQF